MSFKRMKQPNSWTCFPTVAAMITQKPIQDVFDFVGHDGSHLDPESLHPEKKASFNYSEILKYLAHHNYFAWGGFSESAETFREKGKLITGFELSDSTIQYIVDVKSKNFNNCGHVVLYRDDQLCDPNFLTKKCDIRDYEIEFFVPICNLNK